MKTVIIYETTEWLKFYLAEGDLRKFEGVFVNFTDNGLEEELGEIEFKTEITTEQLKKEILNGAYVVHCGFIY